MGAVADMIGGVLAGYAINPLITLGAGAIGLVAGQMCIRDSSGGFVLCLIQVQALLLQVEDGEYPNDEKALEKIVKGICFDNAKRYFNL